MTSHTATIYVTRLPEVKVSELTQLQWAEAQAKALYEEAKENTIAAWKMFDDAVEDWDQEAMNDCKELAISCEEIQGLAWCEWDNAKRVLLAHYS